MLTEYMWAICHRLSPALTVWVFAGGFAVGEWVCGTDKAVLLPTEVDDAGRFAESLRVGAEMLSANGRANAVSSDDNISFRG